MDHSDSTFNATLLLVLLLSTKFIEYYLHCQVKIHVCGISFKRFATEAG